MPASFPHPLRSDSAIHLARWAAALLVPTIEAHLSQYKQ
jgi:hypothetical protein